jgi:hypothetical protein
MGRKNFNLRRIWNRLRKSLAQRGVPSTAALLLRKLFTLLRELIAAEDLASGKEKDLYNAGYFGVAPPF